MEGEDGSRRQEDTLTATVLPAGGEWAKWDKTARRAAELKGLESSPRVSLFIGARGLTYGRRGEPRNNISRKIVPVGKAMASDHNGTKYGHRIHREVSVQVRIGCSEEGKKLRRSPFFKGRGATSRAEPAAGSRAKKPEGKKGDTPASRIQKVNILWTTDSLGG